MERSSFSSQNKIKQIKNTSLNNTEKYIEFGFFRSSHRRCSIKEMFLKISQISQENIYVWWMPNNAHFEGATGISVKVFRPTALLKEDSNTGAFL